MTTPAARFHDSFRLALLTIPVMLAAGSARADDAADAWRLAGGDAGFAWQQPATPPSADAAAPQESTPVFDEESVQPAVKAFGDAGSKWWTVGLGVADNFQNAVDSNIYGSYSYFLAKNIEWSLEGSFWHFNQPGDNAVGGSLSVLFRWHFINNHDWTVYVDGGVGLLLASDDVPPDGTSFDFMPRAGAGFTRRLTEEGLRLQVGVSWHHISNARITSDSDNPGRDAARIYAGLIFPF